MPRNEELAAKRNTVLHIGGNATMYGVGYGVGALIGGKGRRVMGGLAGVALEYALINYYFVQDTQPGALLPHPLFIFALPGIVIGGGIANILYPLPNR